MEKQFIISVVMAIYNVENYLEEAIQSILCQDIGFDRIQLIFVNDGSEDNSRDICVKYKDRYPENILYIEKTNGGQASARNIGLEYALGKYVNFMDPDDTMSPNTFSEVINFLENNYGIDVACVPLVYFGAIEGVHGKYRGLGTRNRIIDLVKEPENFILSAASSFYRQDRINDMRFDERLLTEEDTKFNYLLVKNTRKIGYVCEDGVQYNYRKRNEGKSNSDLAATGVSKDTLLAPIIMFDDILNADELSYMDKELIAYELRNRLHDIKLSELDRNISEEILGKYGKYISWLDGDFIARSKWLDTIEKKALFLKLSGRSFGEFVRKGYFSLLDRNVILENVEYIQAEDALQVAIRFYNFEDKGIDLRFISEDSGDIVRPYSSSDLESAFDLKIGEFTVDVSHVRVFRFDRREDKYQLYFFDDVSGIYHKVLKSYTNYKSKLSMGMKKVGPVYSEFGISFEQGIISIWHEEEYLSIERDRILEKCSGLRLPKRMYRGEKKWILIYDRPEKAGDNGEALFNYIMNNEEDDIKERTYFVLNTSCNDYMRMKHKDHIIDFRSEEHVRKFINACTIYSSHNAVQFIYPFPQNEYKYYADLLKYKFIWLQHGVTENDVVKAANHYSTQDDMVVTSTKWEYEEFSSERYYFPHNAVLKTGFSRFDNLQGEKRNVILIAPTWRMDLVGEILPNGHNAPKNDFVESDYYKNYMGILKDSSLKNFLRKNGFQIEFVLHAGFTCYEELFQKIECDCVHLRKMEDFSYSKAISECKLFVTDYSSTAFDAAYCETPVIYFQFDEHDFFSHHYSKSSWDYRYAGFGPVITNAEDVIHEIKRMINNHCNIADVYLSRISNTFLFRDKNNCKRIMDMTREYCQPFRDGNTDLFNSELQDRLYRAESYIRELQEQNEQCGYAWYCLDETRKSFSYRLGYKLTTFPRWVRRVMQKNKTQDFLYGKS